jgi:hypothetical protein
MPPFGLHGESPMEHTGGRYENNDFTAPLVSQPVSTGASPSTTVTPTSQTADSPSRRAGKSFTHSPPPLRFVLYGARLMTTRVQYVQYVYICINTIASRAEKINREAIVLIQARVKMTLPPAARLAGAVHGLVPRVIIIRLSLFSTAQPLYTRIPIIFSTCFSKVTIGYNPTRTARSSRDRTGTASPRPRPRHRHCRAQIARARKC